MYSKLEGELADFAVAEYNANPTLIEGLIAQGQSALETFLAGVFSNVKVGGLAGIILPAIEGGVEKFVNGYIASHTPAQIYTEVGALIAEKAKELGG
jgi:hypothetical protein